MHDTMITIRSTTTQDIPLILDFIKQLAAYERLSEEVTATKEDLMQSLFIDRHGEVYFIEKEQIPIGFLIIYHNFSSFLGKAGLYLEDVYIQPEYRNRGYGKHVLSFVAQLAVTRGCERVEWSVLNWNEPSIAFYNKLKAIPMDEWTVYRLKGEALHDLAAKHAKSDRL